MSTCRNLLAVRPWSLLVAVSLLATSGGPLGAQEDVEIRQLLTRLEDVVRRADRAGFMALLTDSANRPLAEEFATEVFPAPATRVVIQERERQRLPGTLPGQGYRLLVDTFVESGKRGRILTFQLDVKKIDAGWRLAAQERLSSVESLFHLEIDRTRQYEARRFVVTAEDLEINLTEGSVFVIEADDQVTGLVLLGRGDMRFSPPSATEKGQVRLFSGSTAVESRFDGAYIRFGSVASHADLSQLVAKPVDPRLLRQAERIFREESPKSYTLDLADLSRDTWSLLPSGPDFLADIRTRRFDTLTYARSSSEAEDISLFDRRRQRNIAVYASAATLAERGPFYNEDDLAIYDVVDYQIDLTFSPTREWLEGRASLRLTINAPFTNQITLRLAETLTVQSVTSSLFGRLFAARVRNQNAVMVSLPATLLRGSDLTLSIQYSGRLAPMSGNTETLALQQPAAPRMLPEDIVIPRPEPRFLYSNRNYWYPQPPITDYATATLRITVPSGFSCIASGEADPESPQLIPGSDPALMSSRYVFNATRPLRYLAFLVSRFAHGPRTLVDLEDVKNDAGDQASIPGQFSALDLATETNPRQTQRGKEISGDAIDIFRFFYGIMGDSPYSTLTLALVDDLVPGGHSPAHFVALNLALPATPLVWRNDPAAFNNFPEFFLAHEIAHQWWGQAVGWRNYHDQWLSEGFAQYFATLYAQHRRGDEVFASALRQLRKWSIEQSDQGPVYLGYRLGHVRNDSRVFRALVYNKGAAVLHMLRRFVGDDAFFKGLRTFYRDFRYSKAGTEDLRTVMEDASGRPLARFFERWIYGSTLPRLILSHRMETGAKGQELVLRVEQVGDVFDVPVSLTVEYSDRKAPVLVIVDDRVVERRVPLAGMLRNVSLNTDDGVVAELGDN